MNDNTDNKQRKAPHSRKVWQCYQSLRNDEGKSHEGAIILLAKEFDLSSDKIRLHIQIYEAQKKIDPDRAKELEAYWDELDKKEG